MVEYMNVKLVQLLQQCNFKIDSARFHEATKNPKLKRIIFAYQKNAVSSITLKIVNDTVIMRFSVGKKFTCKLHCIETMKQYDYFANYLNRISRRYKNEIK